MSKNLSTQLENDAERYTYRVFWSDEDEAYIATVAEFPSLSAAEQDRSEALSSITNLVADIIQEMQDNGEIVPVPLGSRKFSGKISLRMTPEQHRRVAIEAAEQQVSINQLLVSRI